MTRLAILIGAVAMIAVAVVVVVGSDGDDTQGGSASSASSASTTTASGSGTAAGADDASVCNYFFEWLDRVRFPLQADPHAAYTYVVPKVSPASDHIGFTVKGPAPYAPWTSWMVYTGKAQPFSVISKTDITPDAGNVNPWAGAPTSISAPTGTSRC